ncbi:Rtn protein [Vibrio sp. RC586]|uniref:sensor domain-containing phosphodiesterase n=1 Tax=Vibrio sp. RC586 TaxID=675815 RepID=UPI0001BB857E|nr:EAL domain-containing protein [Vibrio sp. RC586]EEY98296.1 Rtn protein [Vibrio sp. RC586]
MNKLAAESKCSNVPTRYAALSWCYQIANQHMEYDLAMWQSLIGDIASIKKPEDFLDFLPLTQREQALHCLASSGQHPQTVNSFLVNAEKLVALVAFTVVEVNHQIITGHITPLLIFHSGMESAFAFDALFDNRHHGVVITDGQTRILACNRYFEEQTGYQQSEMLGLKTSLFNSGKHSQHFYVDMWHQLQEQGWWDGTILSQRSSGEIWPQDLSIKRLSPQKGQIFYIGFTTDLAPHLDRVIDQQAGDVELLTQLPTLAKFSAQLKQRLLGHLATTGFVLAIQPKFSSDKYYAQIRGLAASLAQNRQVQLCGYHGEGIFLCQLDAEKGADNKPLLGIQRTLRQFFEELHKRGGHVIHQAIAQGRLGVSVLGGDTQNVDHLIPHALQAMLEHHAGDTRHINFYDQTMHQQAERRKTLEKWVQKWIDNGDVEVFYQPIIDSQTWSIVKFEALCRFQAPEVLHATTQELITIAEELGLIDRLDGIVGRKALSDLPKIHALFGYHIGVTINRSLSVGLTAEQILRVNADMLAEQPELAKYITIELTESAYFDSRSQGSKMLQSLRDMGVTIAIDDFGTGFSSFSYLTECQFDYLKIDREFVSGIELGSRRYAIVKMMTDLAHTLEVKVVAEGVETEYEVHVLRSLGVDLLQGFFFAKPLPISRLIHAMDYRKNLGLSGREEEKWRKEQTTLQSLATFTQHRLDPSDPISIAVEYFNATQSDVLPVVVAGECVGLVDRAALNLHLTPTMGTELETSREAAMWRKPVNQVMQHQWVKIPHDTDLRLLPSLLKSHSPPPWVLVEGKTYKGMITAQKLLTYLASQ